MSMTYQWKAGFRAKGDPEIVGRELEAIQEEHGSIAPELVVDKAKDKASPLHGYFEWNNTTAANLYRVDQARYLIRAIAVKIERDDDDPIVTRAFVEMKQEEAAGSYVSIAVVSQDEEMRKALVEQAMHDIAVFRQKYAVLVEVFGLLDALQVKLEALK